MSPSLSGLSRLANAIGTAVDDRGKRGAAEVVGSAKSTIQDWGADLSRWPLLQAIHLAHADEHVRAALLDVLVGIVSDGSARDVERNAMGVLMAFGAVLAGLSGDLADGKVTPAEARAGLPGMREFAQKFRRLTADYEAVAACGGVVGHTAAKKSR